MSFYTSLSGLRGAQTDLSTISNNIANVGSIGFKRSRAQFGDIMPASSTTRRPGHAPEGHRAAVHAGRLRNLGPRPRPRHFAAAASS